MCLTLGSACECVHSVGAKLVILEGYPLRHEGYTCAGMQGADSPSYPEQSLGMGKEGASSSITASSLCLSNAQVPRDW